MASFCDAQAAALGALVAEEPVAEPATADDDSTMCGLADRAVQAGGDCCVPASARGQGGESAAATEAQQENLHAKGP